MKLRASLFICLNFVVLNLFAVEHVQQSDSDTLQCAQNLSVYSLNLKKKMYDFSIGPWRKLFFECPDLHVNIYSDGIKLMEHYMNKSVDEVERRAYVDTIMMIYDQRMVYFGKHHRYPEGWIWGRKGIDILKYRNGDVNSMTMAYDCFNRSFQLQGNLVEIGVMFAWIQAGRNLFRVGEIKEDEFLSLYFNTKDYTETLLSLENDSSKILVLNKLNDFSDRMLQESLRNRCEVIEEYLKSANILFTNDAEKLQESLLLMEKMSCVSSVYYIMVLEKVFESNCNSETALKLARAAVKSNDYNKARTFYQKALQHENDLKVIAIANYEWAVIEMSHYKNLTKALSLARMSVQLNPDWGLPYLLIGNIYAQAANNFGDNEFEKQTVYWAAVDKFLEAMKVDSVISAEALKYVETYSKYFPDRETAFFYGYKEGEQINIGSWINESTKVRFN